VVLADAEDVEAHLVGQLDLLEQVVETLPGTDGGARSRVRRQLGEGVETKFHGLRLA
jgi:hypothetical protein